MLHPAPVLLVRGPVLAVRPESVRGQMLPKPPAPCRGLALLV